MATGSNIRTYFNGTWHDGDVPIMQAADHGAWLGSSVFDGARMVNGLTPDLYAHCERVNRSAQALMLTPTVSTEEMVAITREGLTAYSKDAAVYIRPMYWGIDGDVTAIVPLAEKTGFAICLEEIPLAPPSATVTLTRTRFRRPVLEDAVVNAKAGCLYPNNARALQAARDDGFDNCILLDMLGNVAELATANIFMVKDGVIHTPAPNGTFLSGITRHRVITEMRAAGHDVQEGTLSISDFEEADEIFATGNYSKVMPINRFKDRDLQPGPMAAKARELYWKFAHAVA